MTRKAIDIVFCLFVFNPLGISHKECLTWCSFSPLDVSLVSMGAGGLNQWLPWRQTPGPRSKQALNVYE